jgi:hypothetical protein
MQLWEQKFAHTCSSADNGVVDVGAEDGPGRKAHRRGPRESIVKAHDWGEVESEGYEAKATGPRCVHRC